MWNQLKVVFWKSACALWCHRMVYAGIAVAYGASAVGWIGKEVLQQVLTALYVLLVAQSGGHR